MAKQKGILPLQGTIDNISFYIHKEYGPLARRKGGPSSEQVKTSPSFDLTRRNCSEFGKASHYGKLLRLAFKPLINHCRETKLDTNLSSRLRTIIRMDTESEFGRRDLRSSTIQAFRHFELDSGCLSSQYFELPAPIVLKDKSLEVIAALRFGKRPPGVDAWKVKSVAVSLDLIAGTIESQVIESELNDFSNAGFAEAYAHDLTKDGLIFHGMGVVFHRYDKVIDEYAPVKEAHVNAGFISYAGGRLEM